MNRIKITFLAILLLTQVNFSEVRYVSKTGSSTPPYLSWETASDSIQECINISNFGDTIYVGNGVYKEKVVMIPGLALIGAGMDSCVIDLSDFTSFIYAVEMKDSCLFEKFKLKLQYSGVGVYMSFTDSVKSCIVRYNDISYASHGISITEGQVKHNFINKSNRAVSCVVFDESHQYLAFIDSNFISYDFIGIQVGEQTIVYATNNIFKIEGEFDTDGEILYNALSGSSTPNFSNNVIVKPKYDLYYRTGISNSYPGNFTNNLFLAKFKNVFYSVPVTIKNNNIIGSQNAVYGGGSDVKYNNFWKVSSYPSDSTNISADPMFVNDTSDFHLQMYSPLIDAGDPTILDEDGSRSDIGLYGGPLGHSYKYEDLPPRTPGNFTAVRDSEYIHFRWNRNTEADFGDYRLYRDTAAGFNIDTSRLIASPRDTFYTDIVPGNVKVLYYKLTSIDKQENESEPGEEIAVIIIGINDYWVLTSDYYLYQNYPNPFNPSTKIGYRLSRRGYVKMYVYDITGSVIAVLVNEEKEPGYYEAEYTAGDISSGIYLCKIDITDSEKRIPVYTGIKKMIYIK